MFSRPGMDITYYPDYMMSADELRDFYENVVDIEPFTTGPYTWTGYTCESLGTKCAVIDTTSPFQISVNFTLESSKGKISLEDADVLAILGSIEVKDDPKPATDDEDGWDDDTDDWNWDDEEEDPVPEEPADPLLEFWNGDWYGWWTVINCQGKYEELEGSWWDACAVIDIGSDYTGSIEIWDEDGSRDDILCDADISLSPDGTGEHGTMMSESGWFMDADLAHADWIIDPGLLDYDGMIMLDGSAEGEDSYDYAVFLRKWGERWDDVEAAEPEQLPYRYYDWYLPQIEAGRGMPDVIGEDGVEDGSIQIGGGKGGEAGAPTMSGDMTPYSRTVKDMWTEMESTITIGIPGGSWHTNDEGYDVIIVTKDGFKDDWYAPEFQIDVTDEESSTFASSFMWEDQKDIDGRTIGGIEMKGYSYTQSDRQWVAYYGKLPNGLWTTVRMVNRDADTAGEMDAMLDSISYS